jgi:transposase
MISLEKREKAVLRVLGGEKISTVGRSLNISRGSIYSWVKAYQRKGFTGLLNKSTRAHSPAGTLDDESIDQIIQTSFDYPGENIRSLKDILEKDGYKYSLSTIHKYLKRTNIVSTDDRINRLLLYSELEGISTLSKHRLETLKTFSPHFADRLKLAEKAGTKFLVMHKRYSVGKPVTEEVPIWYFIDLRSLYVTAIVDDHLSFDPELTSKHEQFTPLNERCYPWGDDVITPLKVWWEVYGEVLERSSVNLIFLKNALGENSKSLIKKHPTLSELDIEIASSLSGIPMSFVYDFQQMDGKVYLRTRPELDNIGVRKRRFQILANEIKDCILDFNSTPLKHAFPMSKRKPIDGSPFDTIMLQNPSIKLGDYLTHKTEGSDLFYSHDENFNSDYMNMALASHHFDPALLTNLHEDVRETLIPPRLINNGPKIKKKNAFQRGNQEIQIKEYTFLKTTSDLKRLSEKIPFILVYLLVMGELPQSGLFICPRCKKKAMVYYPKPKEGYKSANIGHCFTKKGRM